MSQVEYRSLAMPRESPLLSRAHRHADVMVPLDVVKDLAVLRVRKKSRERLPAVREKMGKKQEAEYVLLTDQKSKPPFFINEKYVEDRKLNKVVYRPLFVDKPVGRHSQPKAQTFERLALKHLKILASTSV